MSPHAWQRLAKTIEGPSETLDRLCLWAWRRYHRAEQRQAARDARVRRRVGAAASAATPVERAATDTRVPVAR